MELDFFIKRYPRLYHMAERGTWSSIKSRGLLSTSAVLDQLDIKGTDRQKYETEHRPEKMTVAKGAISFVLRDQKPMPPERISKALIDGTSPQQWYQFLNRKVFMWAEEARLLKLLNARLYKNLEHDVLTINSAALIAKYKDHILVCRMNSGNTFPYWHAREFADFMPIEKYPMKNSDTPLKPIVEVVVNYAIPDIADFVTEVRSMCADKVLANLPL